jgi:CheY-like chemotaxis protein
MTGRIETVKDLVVLAVDDEPQARDLLRLDLNELGISQVYMAKDGKEALDFLDDCDGIINVIICDWNMPRVSGLGSRASKFCVRFEQLMLTSRS